MEKILLSIKGKFEKMKKQKGISMVSLVITIIVILILSVIVFVTSIKTIDEADYSKYVSNVSDVSTAFYEASTAVNGNETTENQTKSIEQVYNYVAKDGTQEEHFLPRSEVPTYTVIKDEGQIGISLPEIIVESGTGKRVPLKYATTKNGQIFTWPPFDYDGKFYITDTDTVDNKMQTEIMVGDEKFEIEIDSIDGTLLDSPEKTNDNDGIEENLPTEEHDFSVKMETPEYLCSEATCISPTIYYYKCVQCNEKGTETYTSGSALGHNYGEWKISDTATCATTGERTKTCSRCGDIQKEDIAKDTNNHIGGETSLVTEATCLTTGTKTYKCNSCGAIKRTETINALGHSWSDFSITTEATCVKKGIKTRKCERCKISETEEIPIDVENHSSEVKETTTDATCTEEGKIVSVCSLCKVILNIETIASLGHSWSDFSITTEATCVNNGIKTRTCGRCQISETKETPIDGGNHHGSEVKKTTTDATCTEEGKIVSTCSLCKIVLNTEIIEALGHIDENNDRKCDRCGILIGYAEKFSDNTWAQIADACYNNAVPDTWLVGDTKSMLIDGEDYDVMIIGKHHDTFADGSGTAPLTFQTVGSIGSKPMNTARTNEGGWPSSDMYNTLNVDIFNVLENDVKNNIKSVTKYTKTNQSINLDFTDENIFLDTFDESSDKLFLLSLVEVFGDNAINYYEYYDSNKILSLEGAQYEYYANGGNVIKSNASNWWLRTPYSHYINGSLSENLYFYDVTYKGNAIYEGANNSRLTSFAFCFAGHPHEYVETVMKVENCTETGMKMYTCKCRYSYTEEIPALGHTTTAGICATCGEEIWQLSGQYTFNDTIDNSSYQGEYEIDGILGLTYDFTKMIIGYEILNSVESHTINILRKTGEIEEMYNSTDGYVTGNSAITVNTVDVTKEFYDWWILNTTVPECFVEGTYIMLADGTQKPIEEITFNDEVMAWDFHTGTYTITNPSLIEAKEEAERRVINLYFADDTTVRIITDHGFFDSEKNKFVFISESNVNSYIGHKFIKVDENNQCSTVELVDYTITNENISCYTIQTAIYNNCIAEGMFTLTSPPEGYDGWFDYFEIGQNMKYDEDKKQLDIEQYGLYTYEEFKEYVTYEQFIAFNGPYLKILVEKGVITFEQILDTISKYANVMM